MKNVRKLYSLLGVKGSLCIASWVMIALALISYTATVSITPTQQFTIGATSDSWTIYINDLDKTRYLPGGFNEPTLNASNPNTYAFKVGTDPNMFCAVKIEPASPVNSSKFSKFQITVKYWNGSAWADETLYANPTGSTTKPYIDGLTAGDAGYIHQDKSTTKWYLIEVLYSYDLTDETTQLTVTFKYTPLPQDSS
ncbi:MAG: hypothetical protein QXU46_04820 [Candidatus Bathyarchaeia archaeon]